MSSQSKLIKDILSTYDSILENKKISEATDVYDNVDFKDNVVPNSTPSKDNINTTLLQDVQTAAKKAGVKVDITTAISGHVSLPSRHPSGNAVDIARINGKSVSPSNREDADKLVDELVKMGYVKNKEKGYPKSVLTFGFKNHDDHVHVSNTTNSKIDPNTEFENDELDTDEESTNNNYKFVKQIAGPMLNAIGLKEERVYSSFGRNYSLRYGDIIIPKENNERIKSPVLGVITSYSYNSSCSNQLVIRFEVDGDTLFLEYCGLNSISVREGDSVSKGDLIGTADSDVRVSLYDSGGNRKHINTDFESRGGSRGSTDSKKSKYTKGPDIEDDSGLLGKNEYSKLFIKGYRDIKNNWFKRDKLQENVNRIKGLL